MYKNIINFMIYLIDWHAIQNSLDMDLIFLV